MTNKQLWICGIAGFMGICAMGTTIMVVPNGETLVLVIMMGSMLLSVFGFIVYDEIMKSKVRKTAVLSDEDKEAFREALVSRRFQDEKHAKEWLKEERGIEVSYHEAEYWMIALRPAPSSEQTDYPRSIDCCSCIVNFAIVFILIIILIPVFIRARENAAKRNHTQMNNSINAR